MRVIDIPEEICNTVGTQRYTVDHIGESDSEVRMYEHYVLKIRAD